MALRGALSRVAVTGDTAATRAARAGLVRAERLLATQLATAVDDDRPALAALTAALDSAHRAGGDVFLDDATGLVLARAWETLGDLPRARAAAARRVRGLGNDLFAAPRRRARARLAELAGDRAGAMAAWGAYVRLRADPEASLREDVDAARARLARLVRGPDGVT